METSTARPTVFVSYSHQDEAWKDRLVKQLRVLELEGDLEVWDDRRIAAGDDWLPEIEAAMARARVAVLLISADFLISEFILGKEVPELLRRRESEGLRVIPVIVQPCAWTAVQWLSKIACRPKDGKELASFKKPKAERHLADLALEVRGLLIAPPPLAPPPQSGKGESALPSSPSPGQEGAPSPTPRGRVGEALRISLPTADSTGRWIPPPGTPFLDEEELLRSVPQLRELKDQEGRVLFSEVVFEKPEREGKVRGFWEDHLNQIQQLGHIFIWSRAAGGNNLIVGTLVGGALHQTVFRDSQVLRRSSVIIATCTPFVQEPVPGSPTPAGDVRYPDLPLKAEYLDLVDTSEGKSLLDRLKREEDIRPFLRRPSLSRDAQGHLVSRWSIPLRGRSLPMPVEIRLEGEPFHKAHWMIWPRFRTPRGAWKAYYVYEYCTDPRLLCDVLWLQSGASSGPGVRLLHRPYGRKKDAGPYPVGYSSRDGRVHVGGPPLALSVRNFVTNEEGGLYMIPLQPFPKDTAKVSLAVDFGTSHTVASFQLPGGQSRPIELTSDLDPAYTARSLTLHLSEARSHVEAEEVNGGLLAAGTWLPTYREKKSEGMLPSELLLILLLEEAQAKRVLEWVPLQDFTIPPMDISRSDIGEFLIAVNRDTGSSSFRGQEKALREHYLTLILEMILAEIVAHHLKGLPVHPVNLTLTYPLRSTEMQVQSLHDSLARVVERCGRSLGLTLVLHDVSGLYDESRAARLQEIRMKDFFISFNSADRSWADWIAWVLEEAKYSVVYQPWDFRPGGNFVLEMQKAASDARKTVIVLSDHYLKADYTQPEWAAAFVDDPRGDQRKLIPFRVEKCSPTGLLKPLIYADLVGLIPEKAKETVLSAVSDARPKPPHEPGFPGKATTPGPAPVTFPGTPAPTPQAATTPKRTSRALALWQEKLEFLREEEAIAVDAAQKFALRKQIEEAEEKIRELTR